MKWIALLIVCLGLLAEKGWRFTAGYIALLAGVTLAAILVRIAYELWTMPEWERREIDERRARIMRDRAMVRFLRSRR